MSMFLFINFIEASARIKALLHISDRLKELGTEYQEGMGSMAESWQGSSGASFAEAAEKVQAGFYVNGFVLERMVNDATTSRLAIAGRDDLAASEVGAMAAQV